MATATTDGTATVTVRNSGARIPVDQVAGLFEPFRRLAGDRVGSGARAGHGLGLSIVDAVAGAHHGHVRAEPLDQGGLAVIVSVPAQVQRDH